MFSLSDGELGRLAGELGRSPALLNLLLTDFLSNSDGEQSIIIYWYIIFDDVSF